MEATSLSIPEKVPTGWRAHCAGLRTWQLILVFLLALGIGARCRQYFGCPSYWYDEAYFLLNVFDKSFSELIGPLESSQAAPPLYLWALRALYLVAGPAEWSMRLPAAAASLAALLLMIPLARRVAGTRGWFWAVGLCAVSMHAVVHAYEAKPYSSDFLVTVVILLASALALSPTSVGTHRWHLATLLAIALFAPWMSFPSIFVLGGASLALLIEACRRGSRGLWLHWFAFNFLTAGSWAILWLVAGRYMKSPALNEYWRPYFLDLSSFKGALKSVSECLVGIGNYGTTGMGIPILILAAPGIVMLWRRSQALAVLLAGPLLLALAGSALRCYPLDDRLVFFAVPCLWLPAAVGIGAALERVHGRGAVVATLAFAVLLAPGTAKMTKSTIWLAPKVDFKEAFAFVQEHRVPEDEFWVLYAEVYKVYYGQDPSLLGWYTPGEIVEQAARKGRLWIVYPELGRGTAPGLIDRLEAIPCHAALRHHFTGLDVVLYER